MEQTPHKYITVAYDLYADNAQGIHELMEKAFEEHPYQFITGMGVTLEAFEKRIAPLNAGDTFDFTLSVDEAYGPYMQEHVVDIPIEHCCINGRLDRKTFYPGNVIQMVNDDGNRFDAIILEVKEDKVVVDLNNPFAGKDLHFRGKVLVSREATPEEIQGLINMMSGEGCGCGCGSCGGGCHDEDGHEGGCCGHGEGKGHHHHGEGCCGGHEGHHHEGGCCGHGEGKGHHHHGEGCCGGGHKH